MSQPFKTLLLFGTITIFLACNSGKDKKETKGDTSAVVPTAVSPVLKDEVIVKHHVANYAKWRSVFDTDSSQRLAAGLHDHIIGRGLADSNEVLLVFYMDDTSKAKAFSKDPRLQEVMKKAGVTGKPNMNFIHRVATDPTDNPERLRVMVKHRVNDFDAWKKIYDEDKPNRVAAGLSDKMVGHAVDDNHNVVLIFVVNDEAKAKAFMGSKALADKMKAGGVSEAPLIFFYGIVEKK